MITFVSSSMNCRNVEVCCDQNNHADIIAPTAIAF